MNTTDPTHRKVRCVTEKIIIIDECVKNDSMWLMLIGYVFVAVVAIIAALRIENLLIMVLLVISAIISLTLAITRLISAKKTGERIKYLEENQLSVSFDAKEETVSFKKGIDN